MYLSPLVHQPRLIEATLCRAFGRARSLLSVDLVMGIAEWFSDVKVNLTIGYLIQ